MPLHCRAHWRIEAEVLLWNGLLFNDKASPCGNHALVSCTGITHSKLQVGLVVQWANFKLQSPLGVPLRSSRPRWSSLHLKTMSKSRWLYFARLKGHPFPPSGREPFFSLPLPNYIYKWVCFTGTGVTCRDPGHVQCAIPSLPKTAGLLKGVLEGCTSMYVFARPQELPSLPTFKCDWIFLQKPLDRLSRNFPTSLIPWHLRWWPIQKLRWRARPKVHPHQDLGTV